MLAPPFGRYRFRRLRVAVRLCITAALLLVASAVAAQTLSDNRLVELAGQARYDELAAALAPRIKDLSTGELHALCYAYSRTKRYRQLFDCLDRLAKAVSGRDKSTILFGLDDATPTVHLMRAEAQIDIGQAPVAIDEAKRALAWFEKEGGTAELDIRIEALALLGIAAARTNDRTGAAGYLSQLEGVRVSWNTAGNIPTLRALALARVHLALEQYDKACAALKSDTRFDFRKSIEEKLHFSPPNWVWQELPRNFMLAKCQYGMGRMTEAKAAYDALLAIPSVRQNSGIYWMILFDRGHIAESEGDLEGASRYYRDAIETIELLRSSINTEAAKIGFVTDKQAVYAAQVNLLLRQDRPAQALEYVERGKSRAFVDLLADRFVAAGAARVDRGDASVAGMLEQHRAAEETLLAQSPGRDDATAGQQRNAVLAATESIRKAAPQVASLIAVPPVSADALARLLEPDEVGIQYYGFGDRLFALTFGPQGTRGFTLSAAGLLADIRDFRSALARRSPQADEIGRKLYARLIAPLEPVLGNKALLIVPHGGLHYLPFAALSDGKGYLIEKHALRITSSASALQFLHEPAAGTLPTALILGNPTLDLPSAEDEARRLGRKIDKSRVLLRRDATRDAFLQMAPRYRMLHLATHGVFEPQRPLESKIVLAPGKEGSGELNVSELYGLTLNADLVTLSACETGLGRITDGGDVIGMTRGFLYAGSRSVVASLWPVADEATLQLMERFYANLARLNKRDALRAAQLETARTMPQPYFWAAFYLTGAAK